MGIPRRDGRSSFYRLAFEYFYEHDRFADEDEHNVGFVFGNGGFWGYAVGDECWAWGCGRGVRWMGLGI